MSAPGLSIHLGAAHCNFFNKYLWMIPQKKRITLKQMGLCACALLQFFLARLCRERITCSCKIAVMCVKVWEWNRQDQVKLCPRSTWRNGIRSRKWIFISLILPLSPNHQQRQVEKLQCVHGARKINVRCGIVYKYSWKNCNVLTWPEKSISAGDC